ncbi:MAG TPA: hypothetical protein VK163_04905 [Opitutaceae bacterium]|nr:hypothetical protein [Opitutaceae bacterium]
MKRLLACALLLFGVWFCARPQPAARWAGRPATTIVQSADRLPSPWTAHGCTFTPLARFEARAVVLSRERYFFDRGAKLAPIDLALGWGPMAEAATINALRISQDHRWYEYRWSEAPPIPPEAIVRSSANMHLIPEGPAVRAALLAVRRHELVELAGYLVEVRSADGWRWRSSTSREDSGGGSCEVVWVERVANRRL